MTRVPRTRVTTRQLELAAVVAVCAVGLWLRVSGLTSHDLWFDDAWAALPAHVGLSDAIRMVVTTPLYTLGLREWLRLGPTPTWWGQLPALVLGVGGIAAVWRLVRSLGFGRLAALGGAAVVMAGPITVAYATRLKEYPADLLCACLVLWLAERWRRSRTDRNLAALGAVSVVCLWVSASTAVVVGGAAIMVVAAAWGDSRCRRAALVHVGVLAAASVGLWAAFLRRVPAQLRTNWRTHGFLFGYSSQHHLAYTFQQTFSGLAHGLLGVPLPWTSSGSAVRAYPMALAIVAALGLIALVEPDLSAVLRSRGRTVGTTFAAAASVVLAIAGTLSGLTPLGDGRTDEVLYPSLVVLLVAAGTSLARRATATDSLRRTAATATAGAVVVVAFAFGVTHRAAYPPTGLRQVLSVLETKLLPGDVVVIDGYESFTYADDSVLGGWKVSFARTPVPWPMGFHVVSLDAAYVLSTNYLQPDQQITDLARTTRRVWYVGPTVGGYSTAAPKDLWLFPYVTPTITELEAEGFVGVDAFASVPGAGVYAQLLVLRPR